MQEWRLDVTHGHSAALTGVLRATDVIALNALKREVNRKLVMMITCG